MLRFQLPLLLTLTVLLAGAEPSTAAIQGPVHEGKQSERSTASNSFLAALDLSKAQFGPSALSFATYMGGQFDDAGTGIAVDSTGIYVTGLTNSPNFPIVGALQPNFGGGTHDAFVAKLDPTGRRLIYATYLGGSGDDEGWAIAVDASGAAYVTGKTTSTDFPVVNAVQPTNHGGTDAFIAKISPDGTRLLYSTYLGGSSEDSSWGVGVDPTGSAFIAGDTASADFPTANALQPSLRGSNDAFVARFSPSGTQLLYSTYLGGSNYEESLGIAVDGASSAYVIGSTSSTDFPTANPFQPNYGGGAEDVFVTKLDSTGRRLVYSTYFGGSAQDHGWAIAVSGAGNAYVTGWTGSTNFPTQTPIQPANAGGVDAFAAEFDSTGTHLVYSTYLGGDGGYDGGYGVAVDSGGSAYYTGLTTSDNFPAVNAVQPLPAGSDEFFITKISAGGSGFDYSTYLGGSASDYGYGIAVDAAGSAYIAGQSLSTNFPVVNALQSVPGGDIDAAVVKISAPCGVSFNDVPPTNPFYSDILCLACRGIITGYSDSTYRPGNNLTRAQTAKIVAASAGYGEPPGTQIYQDVPPSDPFFTPIQRLTLHGVLSGYACGQAPTEPCVPPDNLRYFRPGGSATRSQLAQIVALAAGYGEPPGGQVFQDVAPDSPFYASVQRLASRDIVAGYPCGGPNEPCVPPENRPYFRPGNNITRGQASKIAANAFFPNCQIP